MPHATVRNINMSYDHLGSGQPLVLIHGLGERKEGWDLQHSLAHDYELIIPDLRGHGESITTNDISIESFACDILALLDQLNISSAHICGLSMGGAIAQEIYRKAPLRCKSLILANTFHYAPKTVRYLLYAVRESRSKYLSADSRLQIAARTCLYSWDEETIDRFLHVCSPNTDAYLPSMESCLKVDNRRLLPTIKIPTLLIGGQYDAVTPVWIQLEMHHQIPHSQLIVLRNAGHLAKLETPDRFNKAIRQFLRCQKPIAS